MAMMDRGKEADRAALAAEVQRNRELDERHRAEDMDADLEAAKSRVHRAEAELEAAVRDLNRLESMREPVYDETCEEPDEAIRKTTLADVKKTAYSDLPF